MNKLAKVGLTVLGILILGYACVPSVLIPGIFISKNLEAYNPDYIQHNDSQKFTEVFVIKNIRGKMDFLVELTQILEGWPDQDDRYSGDCTAFAIDEKYAVTAAHCVEYPNEQFVVEESDGSQIILKAVAYDKLRDHALLKGDLSMHNALPIDAENIRTYGKDKLVVGLGYPSAQKTLVGSVQIIVKAHQFRTMTMGMPIFPGMSGGPVIDKETGDVIGINSIVCSSSGGAFGDASCFTPTIGLFGGFGIEPK